MTQLNTTVHDSIVDVNQNQWNNLVKQSELGTVFHRYEWLRAIEDGLDRPVYHAVVSKGSNPVAILPNVVEELDVPVRDSVVDLTANVLPTTRLVSLHPGFGGPVIASDPETCLDSLLEALENAVGGEAVTHKVRTGTLSQTKYGKYFTSRGYEPSVVTCRFVIDLQQGWDQIKSGMHKTRRNGLNGERDAVTVTRESFDGERVSQTHADYVRNMDRIDGTTYSQRFFEALSDYVGERTELFVAEHDGDVIGRYLCVVDDEQSSLRYYFSAIPDTSAYEHNVSERLHAAAIKWAIEEGYDSYDLGTTGADFTDGLFQYKEKYGPQIEPIIQWDKGLSPVAWNAFKLGRRLYRKTNYRTN